MSTHERRRASVASPILSPAASLLLVVVVAVAVAGDRPELAATIVACALAASGVLVRLFPTSRLLWIAFVNLIAVYTSIFALFVDEMFKSLSWAVLAPGFALPIGAFLAGCWWRRYEIRAVVTQPSDLERQDLSRAVLWLVPVFLIGALTLSLSRYVDGQDEATSMLLVAMFMGAMATIAMVVLVASRDVAVFLVDTGLLFEEFFQRLTRLVVPAFAFLTFYSMLIVVFAAVFRLTSLHAIRPQFRIGQEERALTFPEALHFSAATLSTVGYGDIVPISTLSRTLAAAEVVLGVLLLLFGVSEIIEYTKERRNRRRDGQI
jgi:voltage-gated potassium channel